MNGTNVPGATSPVYTTVVNSGDNITVVMTSSAGCTTSPSATGSAAIAVGAPISPVRYTTINASANVDQQLQARVFGPNDTYTWSPAVGLNSFSVSNPVFNYSQDTEYLITIAAGTGCTVTDTLLVKIQTSAPPAVLSDVFVPTAFTPNGDGHNDKLSPLLFRIKEFKYFRVFNRWGQLVFETGIPGQGWDGTFKGVPQPAGVFTWTTEATGDDGRSHNKKGAVVLLR